MNENEIMNDYRKRLSEGLRAGKKIDDIERMMGDALDQLRESMLEQTEEIIGQHETVQSQKKCPDCGRDLKKTK